MHYIFLLFPIFYAFAYRARGGAIPLKSTTLARIVFWGMPVGLGMALICHAWGIPLWLAPICGATAYGSSCIGHSSEQGNTIEDHEGMSLITFAMLFLTFLPILGYFLFLPIVSLGFIWTASFPCGLLSGFAYYFGYKITVGFKLFGIQWCVPGDASWGELFTGAFAFGLPMGLIGLFHP